MRVLKVLLIFASTTAIVSQEETTVAPAETEASTPETTVGMDTTAETLATEATVETFPTEATTSATEAPKEDTTEAVFTLAPEPTTEATTPGGIGGGGAIATTEEVDTGPHYFGKCKKRSDCPEECICYGTARGPKCRRWRNLAVSCPSKGDYAKAGH